MEVYNDLTVGDTVKQKKAWAQISFILFIPML